MVSNRKHLHHASDLAVDDAEMEDLEADTANVGRVNNARSQRHCASKGQGRFEFCVVPLPQTFLLILVVSDLLLVLRGRLGV